MTDKTFGFDELPEEILDFDNVPPIHRVHTPSGEQWTVEAETLEHLEKGFASAVHLDKTGNGRGSKNISEAQDWV